MNVSVLWPNFAKRGGVIPVVVQDSRTMAVFMLVYTNDRALRKTLETGQAHYWSTSRAEELKQNRSLGSDYPLWRKGATSGNTQNVQDIFVDCDGDALIYIVEQTGGACHTGQSSCFYRDALKNVSRSAFPSAKEQLAVIDLEVHGNFLGRESGGIR